MVNETTMRRSKKDDVANNDDPGGRPEGGPRFPMNGADPCKTSLRGPDHDHGQGRLRVSIYRRRAQ